MYFNNQDSLAGNMSYSNEMQLYCDSYQMYNSKEQFPTKLQPNYQISIQQQQQQSQQQQYQQEQQSQQQQQCQQQQSQQQQFQQQQQSQQQQQCQQQQQQSQHQQCQQSQQQQQHYQQNQVTNPIFQQQQPLQHRPVINKRTLNDFAVSKVLFSGGSPLPVVDLDNIGQSLSFQDTPPSSPDNDVSYQQTLYGDIKYPYARNEPLYRHPKQEVNSICPKWNDSKIGNIFNINIDSNLPNLDPNDIAQNFITNANENHMLHNNIYNSEEFYLHNLNRQRQQQQYRKMNHFSKPTNNMEYGNLSPCSSISSDTYENIKPAHFIADSNKINLSLPNQSYCTNGNGNGNNDNGMTLSTNVVDDAPLNFPETFSPQSTISNPPSPVFKTEQFENKPNRIFDFNSTQIKIENICGNNASKFNKCSKAKFNKSKKPAKPRLYKFLRDTLLEKNECIEWVDESTGTFKFLDSKRIAHLWGLRKNKPNMQYENFARSLRTYIKKGILTKPRNKLVYRFTKLPTDSNLLQ